MSIVFDDFGGCNTICPASPLNPAPCNTRMAVEMCEVDNLVHEPHFAVLDAPLDYVRHHIVQSAIIVARDLKCLTRKITMDIQAGVRDYYPTTENDERWLAAKAICVHGRCVDFIEPPMCDDQCRFQVYGYGWFETPCAVMLSATPRKDCARAIRVEMYAVPKRDASMLDAQFVEKYMDAIQTRAVATMRMDKGGKEVNNWYDPNLSHSLMVMFERDLMGRYKIDRAERYKQLEYSGPG